MEINPRTRARFDDATFNRRFGSADVRICERSSVAPGEYHLFQRGFDNDESSR